MAVVIDFASHLRSRNPTPAERTGQVAEILFYTGVRYEREPESAPAAARAARRRRPAGTKLAGAKSVRQPA